MVEPQPSKLVMRVRFPPPALSPKRGEADDPLLEALVSLREIDAAYLAANPDTADDEVGFRMMHLYAVVSAIAELHERGEVADAESVRQEMLRLDDGGFNLNPQLLRELAEGFVADGDEENGKTAAQAFAWTNAQAAHNWSQRNYVRCVDATSLGIEVVSTGGGRGSAPGEWSRCQELSTAPSPDERLVDR